MKTVYRNVEIESTYFGNKQWPSSIISNYNNHKVVVKNLDTGKWTYFEYWESNKEKKITTESQLMFAFYCFLNDALVGEMDYYDFCNEYGYNASEREHKKIWKACIKATEKVNRVLPGWLEGELYNEVMNEMQEKGWC